MPRSNRERDLRTLDTDYEIASVEDFLTLLDQVSPPGSDRWFRGHASEGWDLSASVFRTPARTNNETVLLKRFIQEARRHMPEVPSRWWDWVFLAQHHQVPTRLLDWSESALVGLYFAALDHLDMNDDPSTARDGIVWVLDPVSLNAEQGHVFKGRDIPLFGLDAELDDYLPYGGKAHELPVVAGLAARNFDRISAQWGTFTVGNRATPLNFHLKSTGFLKSVRVPLAAKADVRSKLKQMGLQDRTLYLDLHRLGAHLSEAYG